MRRLKVPLHLIRSGRSALGHSFERSHFQEQTWNFLKTLKVESAVEKSNKFDKNWRNEVDGIKSMAYQW